MGTGCPRYTMNLTLHWLRRDLRRHAPAIALWALLVALFTWARIWLRTHPDFFIGDRDLWLSVPAAALGFAEVCLLLRVLLDDPARGPHAFWKTRPPSGGSVFAAKAVIVAVVALVIPFAAEAVFLSSVGMSSGGAERFTLYLIPPMLALLSGAAAGSWRTVLIWLPAAALVPAGTVCSWLALRWPGVLAGVELRIVFSAALAGCALVSAWLYSRRKAGLLSAAAASTLPVAAAAAVSATGVFADRRLDTPPPGRTEADYSVQWSKAPQVIKERRGTGHLLDIVLKVSSRIPQDHVLCRQLKVRIQPQNTAGRDFRVTALDWSWRNLREMDGSWQVSVDASFKGELERGPCTVSGSLRLLCFDRKRYTLPLHGTHTVDTGTTRWRITPAASRAARFRRYYDDMDTSSVFYQYECVTRLSTFEREYDLVDKDTAMLRRRTDGLAVPLEQFPMHHGYQLWQGSSHGVEPLRLHIPSKVRSTWQQMNDELLDPAQQDNWGLEFDTLTFTGTLEVPFSLTWPETK